jgi:hypothetical protein
MIPRPENYLALIVIAVIAAALAFAAIRTRLRRYDSDGRELSHGIRTHND